MLRFWKLVFAMFALTGVLAGCASYTGGPIAPVSGSPAPIVKSGPQSTSAAAQAVSHVKCERTEQKGCLEIDILNVKWNASSIFMKGIDQAAGSQLARQERRSDLGPALYKAYKAGQVQASQSRTFTIFMWKVARDVPLSHMASYQVNGTTLAKVSVQEGGGELRPPKFDPIADLGAPDRVFRVTADGDKPIGAALQIPWSMITEQTYILVCSEDRLTVYPNRVTAEEGLWLTPRALAEARAAANGRGWDYMLLPFISKDPSLQKKPVSKKPVKKAEGEEQLALASTE